MTFVNTYVREYDIIILVKPPIHYILFLLYPIVKIPSPKRTADRQAVLFLQKKKIRFCDIQSDKFFMKKIINYLVDKWSMIC